jgi:hypothetical protein
MLFHKLACLINEFVAEEYSFARTLKCADGKWMLTFALLLGLQYASRIGPSIFILRPGIKYTRT